MNIVRDNKRILTRKLLLSILTTRFPALCNLADFAFVPKCDPVSPEDLRKLKSFIDDNGKICVLTGAGISTESGIPDYRSEGVGIYAKNKWKPVLYKDFCSSEFIRRRYWTRNYVGWPRFSSFRPSETHKSLKILEDIGKVSCIVTQNVDNLHTKAGSNNIIELHGTAFKVMCLNCDRKIKRSHLQAVFRELNPLVRMISAETRPDGDVETPQDQEQNFVVPSCRNCNGILKPDITFFGDNVPRHVVERVQDNVRRADSLLILGTSLSTYSGYRIVLQAVDAKKPIALINIGKTRADDHVDFKIHARCGETLAKVCTLIDDRVYDRI